MTTPPEPGGAPAPHPAVAPVDTGAPAPSDVPWRRLDTRMLLVAPVQELGRGLIPLIVILFTGFGDPIRTAITGLGALALIAWGVIRFLTTTYRVTPEQVQIRKGLLNRSTSVAPIDRVRSVDVTAPLLHRLLSLGKVVVGTGRTDKRGKGDLVLDSLRFEEAQRLRGELLHRAPGVASPPSGAAAPAGAAVPVGGPTVPAVPGAPAGSFPADAEGRDLVRLRGRWLLYAPFTLSGAVTGLVIVGFGSRLLNEARVDPTRFALTREALRSLERSPLWLDVVQIAIVVVLFVSLLSIVGYLLAFFGFRLQQRTDGTLHVTRGLLTRRETTLEHRRVRGVELHEPLLLRAVRGARLTAVATGVREGSGNERTATLLVPPSPRRVDVGVGAEVVGDRSALEGPLVAHGPAASRRRFTRALGPTVVVVAVLLGLSLSGALPQWVGWTSLVLLPLAAWVAVDRARTLGHRIGGPLVVTRHGSLSRRRSVVAVDGVIGAVVRSSPFQRRAGVATVHLTTAAGRQAYPLTDLPTERAWAVLREVLPASTFD